MLLPGRRGNATVRPHIPRAAMPRTIDYYFSLSSPWAYIGHRLFMTIAERQRVAVNYKPLFLGRVFAQTGGGAGGRVDLKAAVPRTGVGAAGRAAAAAAPSGAAALSARRPAALARAARR